MENVSDRSLTAAYVVSRLNANQNTGAVAGTFTTLSFGVDDESVLNGLIDRPSATQFRALVAGYYELSYKGVVIPAGDSGTSFRILKSGATVLNQFSTSDASACSNGTSTSTQSCAVSHPVQLAVNEYVELQASPTTAAASAVQANTSLSLMLVRAL